MIRETNYDQIHDAQKHFRLIMDAFARPGKIIQLNDITINSPDNLNTASALVGLGLLNNDVKFFSSKNQEEINNFFLMNCSSYSTSPDKAEFIFLDGNSSTEYIEKALEGEPEYPENGASIIIDLESISATPVSGAVKLNLQGPGVDGQSTVYLKNISIDILKCLQEKNNEFPLGVDTILTDTDGNLIAIPRSSKISWQ
jgi:alpha-D-ribose 1-methylphosphonate 5-triphosphate synthase subunit PhnH